MNTPGTVLAALCLACVTTAAAAQDEVRQPPVWPSPSEYLADKGQRDAAVDPEPEPEPEPELEPEPSDAPGAPAYDTGAVADELPPFTVQLGAFRDPAAAQQEAARRGGNEVSVLRLQRGDGVWSVLVLGLYATREEAERVERRYLDNNPGAATWVRTTEYLSR